MTAALQPAATPRRRKTTTVELVPATPAHAAELGRICFEAFGALHERHAVSRDIPDAATGQMIISLLTSRSDCAGVVAMVNGQVVGSNFLLFADEVAGVGPITVDPSMQSQGIGRALMQWAIDEARRRGVRSTRLFQEALNTASFSLYTALGFTWRDSAAWMQAAQVGDDDGSIKPLTGDDLPQVERLSRAAYGSSRAGDAAQLLAADIPGFVRRRGGRIVGYRIASLFGHACAESDEDLLALVAHTARHLPPALCSFICPMTSADGPSTLFRRALEQGHRMLKVMSYMSIDEYEAPRGPQLPSILC